MKMSNEEIARLNTAMKQISDKRLYERYLAVRLRLEGYTFDEIGELLSRARQNHQYLLANLPNPRANRSGDGSFSWTTDKTYG